MHQRSLGPIALFTGLCLSVSLSGVRAQDADPLDQIIREEMSRQRIPGLAVAVIRGGTVVKAQGYGLANVEHQVPVTPDTIFQSGSVGKQFTAAVVMQQVEAGTLRLDEPLTTYFPKAPESWRRITVRHLLTHTSGLPDYTEGRIDYRRDYTEAQLVELAFALPLDFDPGSQWRYSNTGYVLLGVLVGQAAGRFYGDLLQETVFTPLGMRTARIINERDVVPNRAAGYVLDGAVLRNQDWVSPSLNTTADGSLYLSLTDLIAWDRALRARAVLSPDSWAQVYEPVRLTSGRRHPYGFGWQVDRLAGQAVHSHTGSWQGFKTAIARYLGDDLTVIVLANVAQARPSVIGDAIAARLNPKLAAPPAWTITGAQIADGSGGPLRTGNLRIEGDSISAIGDVAPGPDDRVVDGTGLVLAPGFIDTHNHSSGGLETDPGAASQVAQGITTLVLGPDGSSPWPIADYLAARRGVPPAVNVAMLVGHATVRRQVMGDDFRRPATPAEVRRMAALVEQGMREGAAGLSSGLEYEVGSYATTAEMVALAKVAARVGGVYMSHLRDEADRTLEAVQEAITIGEQARVPVQISHIKLGTVGVWGKAAEVIRLVDAARRRGLDITADCYPYLAWQSNLKVLVPNRQWTDPASVKEALDDVGGGKNVQITRLPTVKAYEGLRLDEAARQAGLSEVDLYIRIVADEDAGIIGHTMSEPDMRAFYAQPWVMVASDGGIANSHPRGAGTFPRVLGRFVRESAWLSLPEAIRKMTSLPAARLKLADRGLLRAGMKADVVLFDPATILDRATFAEPGLRPIGMHAVWVNGRRVWAGESATPERPGVVLK